MDEPKYICPKCQNTEYSTEEVHTADSLVASLNASRYTAVICTNCKYVELYKVEAGLLDSVLDLLRPDQQGDDWPE